MPNLLKNKMVKPGSGVNFSRSLFNYEKRHSTNMLAGKIVPVHTQFLYPGSSPDWNFGCVVESAPLISTCLDNIYIDIVSIWCPLRLVMTDWNEFLGESHTQAFTINRNITIPKITYVEVENGIANGNTPAPMSRAYLADNYLAPHLGFRSRKNFDLTISGNIPADSQFAKGISVLPSRIYELNWNTFFRNENIQVPILIDKTSVVGSHDNGYQMGLGSLHYANKLKTFYTVATPNPSLLDVPLALDQFMTPVGIIPDGTGVLSSNVTLFAGVSGDSWNNDSFVQSVAGATNVGSNLRPVFADLSQLTVNRMYYALMEQRFANKMMKGRRAVEFYENFFGVKGSEAGHDMPQLLVHKRFPINISQVIATASGTNGSETSDLGQRGAFSTTGFGDSLVHNFIATEHGYIQTYAIIRGQPSLASGIDKHLSYDSLLDTYIPEFDHIGPVGIERLELCDINANISNTMWAFTNAWYAERNQISDVAGIMEPGQPLEYKTLAINWLEPVISTQAITFFPYIMDRIFMFPVCYGPANEYVDSKGQPLNSNRYQFLIQFAVKGKLAAVMSPDSEPLKLRL